MKPVIEVEGPGLQLSSGASGQTVSQKQIVYNRKRSYAPIIGSPKVCEIVQKKVFVIMRESENNRLVAQMKINVKYII